ncbi:hypothetical protein BDN71DRAFT_1182113 [Pleurotus eryngii]|uniref:Uncharacterized protein n=1 Tax=Pleurotus eryngii TaxID=5323 RepID=A0A9P6D635_PLEER|nr:hypothetical protein BDN71DRAFT_1182113 [Pleurotus eryngii]
MSSSSSSFFSFKPQPQIRQEGFHLPSPPPNDPNHPNNHHQAHPSSPSSSSGTGAGGGNGGGNGGETLPSLLAEPFRKFTHLNSQSSMGFTDELASLIGNGSRRDADLHSNVSQERSTHPHSHTHNIFDISAPKSSVGGGGGGGSSGYFNSTLPALNSSLRFEHPDSQSLGGRHSPTLPLSLPVSLPPLPHSSSPSSQTPTSGSYASSRPAHHRHSTSISTSASSPHLHHSLSHRSRRTRNSSRSRSASRGPSLTPAIPSLNMNIGGMGPIAIPPTPTQNGCGMDASSPTSTSGSTIDGLGTSLTSNVGPTRTSHRGERRDSSASSTLSPSTLNNINMGNMNLNTMNAMNMGMNMFGGGMSFNNGNGNSGIGMGFNSDVPRRGRRGNSVSSNISEISTTASPPPHHHHNQHLHQQNANRQQSPSMSHHPRPIVIPGGGIAGGPGIGANGGGWFMNSQSSEFSLPTPESLHSPLIHHLPQHQQQNAQTFSSFGISPPLDKELGRRSSSHLRSNINGNDNGDENENDNANINVDGDRDNDDSANGKLNNSNQPNGNGVGLPPLSGIAGGVPIPSIGSLGPLYTQQPRQQSQQRNGQHHVGSPTSPILSSSLGGMGGGNFGNIGNMGNLNLGGMGNMGGMGGMGGMNINMGMNMNSMGGMGNVMAILCHTRSPIRSRTGLPCLLRVWDMALYPPILLISRNPSRTPRRTPRLS